MHAVVCRADATAVVIMHPNMRDPALESTQIEIRARLEQFCTARATTEMHVVSVNIDGRGAIEWFLGQTRRTDYQIARFRNVPLGIRPQVVLAATLPLGRTSFMA